MVAWGWVIKVLTACVKYITLLVVVVSTCTAKPSIITYSYNTTRTVAIIYYAIVLRFPNLTPVAAVCGGRGRKRGTKRVMRRVQGISSKK